jgi:uncharacterized RDD family membrane protein YckC
METPNASSHTDDLVRASTGKRFVNYLVDVFFFYVIIVLFGAVIGIFAPEWLDYLDSNDPIFNLMGRIMSLVLYALYMGAIEAMLDGKSIGKLVTKTRAIQLNGNKITSGLAFARGFYRAVPFAAFSAFGDPSDPWQDRWTDTMVIDEGLSVRH